MMRASFSLVVVLMIGLLIATPAHAYIGPGGGLSALGAFLALIAVGVVTFFGFVWYPIKRMLRKKRRQRQTMQQPMAAAEQES